MHWKILFAIISFSSSVLAQGILVKAAFNQGLNPVFAYSEKKIESYINYQNQYFLKEWNTKSAGAVKSFQSSFWGLNYSINGNRKFSKQTLLLNYGRSFSPNFRMAMSLQYQYFTQAEFNDLQSHLAPNIGFEISEEWGVFSGATLHRSLNRSTGKIQAPNHLLFHYSKKVNEQFELRSWLFGGWIENNFGGVLYYNISKGFSLGIGSNYKDYPVGAVLNITQKLFDLKLISNFHNTLPVSNQLVIAWKW